ncbi:hypothetical protein Bcav_0804 [Beutenbergia cavernae DSM 12333]|uniref:Uncharacterized protein n=1 Tax=Beutenbergia cavernae (strain ATCC BAA-8 / DSM 12333 / CCUG 43141 / JCM 11478 / NBRC 16432 / NCIMB 13614 / HKI 0122) TaxID=471853 RepID=C5BYV7_BEUC1|nr:hypothetical protein [Beutenbergia cavernae]ACQ79065.1 hypothetical protein Bcav_0804 [Beutenbergia cavernae DSM 12333]
MRWREATVAELLGRPAAGPGRRPRRAREVRTVPELLLGAARTLALLAAVSVLVVVGSLGVVTAVPALAAGSRLLGRARDGRRVRVVADFVRCVRQAWGAGWLPSLLGVAALGLVGLNLVFLGRREAGLAAPLYVLNVSAALIVLWLLAACVRELADRPSLGTPELARRSWARAVTFGRWHVAVAAAVGAAVALTILVPLAGLFFAAGGALALGRLADPRTPSDERFS